MPFDVPSARFAQASPSISLEKGSYRMRAPPTHSARSSRLQTSKSQSRAQAKSDFIPASYEKRMALLVILLSCATIASFGAAYYLWTTSAKTHPLRHPR